MRQQDIPSIRIDIPPARTLAPDEKINLLPCALAARSVELREIARGESPERSR